MTFRTIIQDKQNIWTNITCSFHLLIKIYSNVYIFNKFKFFIQEIFIIKKFDNVTVSQYLHELNINLSRVNRTTMNLLLKVSRFFHNLQIKIWKKRETLSTKFIFVLFILLRTIFPNSIKLYFAYWALLINCNYLLFGI